MDLTMVFPLTLVAIHCCLVVVKKNIKVYKKLSKINKIIIILAGYCIGGGLFLTVHQKIIFLGC